LRQDRATALRSTTATREVLITGGIKIIAVIVRQLFPIGDISEGDHPERPGSLFDFTVGITGVVAIAGGIPEHLAVNIIAVIEGKDVRSIYRSL
jgi:hypothetical protein